MAFRFRTLASSALLAAVALTGCDAVGPEGAPDATLKTGIESPALDTALPTTWLDTSADKPSPIEGPRAMRPGETCEFRYEEHAGTWSTTGNLTIFSEEHGVLKVGVIGEKDVHSELRFTSATGRETAVSVSIDPNKRGDC